MDATQWQVPRLTPRLQRVSEVTVLVIGLVLFVLITVATTRLWWLPAPVALVLGYLLVVLLTERTWVGPDAVSRRRWSPRPAVLHLDEVTQVTVRARGATGAALVLHGTPTVSMPLVQVTMFDARSQSPDVLRRLADTVAALPGGKDAAMRLRAHATHIADGGAPEKSSLLDR
ncbi:MAG: hypothetical protein FWF02_03140 [Micrococcales bacterium]|nr:hypothetical protein [Micrococcales bacterium]MCL2666685.1 hypothetical protein [Micrococcales bacterium]